MAEYEPTDKLVINNPLLPLLQKTSYGGVPPVIINDSSPFDIVDNVGFTPKQETPNGNITMGSHSFLFNMLSPHLVSDEK